MAKPKAVVDSIEEVEEALRPLYEQGEDGKFYVQVEGFDPREVSALRKEAADRRKALQELKGKVPDDFDPEEWKRLKSETKKREREREEAERDKQKREGDFEAREKKLVEKHEQELKAEREKAERFQRQRDKALMDDAARKAIHDAKGKANLLLPHVLKRLRIEENDKGEAVVVVLDENGEPAVADGRGSSLTLPKLIDEFKASDEFGVAFEGSGASGGGAQPSAATRGGPGGSGTVVNGIDLSKAKPEEKLKAIHSGKIPAIQPQRQH